MCRRGCVGPKSHTHTRAHGRTDAARGRACAAGPHRRSVRPCSKTPTDTAIPSRVMQRERQHSRTCRAAPYRRHTHASTRGCIGDTTTYTFAYAHERSTHIYISLMCASIYIYSDGQTRARAHTHNVAGRIVGELNRTHAHMDGRDAAAGTLTANSSQKHPSIYRYWTVYRSTYIPTYVVYPATPDPSLRLRMRV
jgi:hypothetical protein